MAITIKLSIFVSKHFYDILDTTKKTIGVHCMHKQ